jgi:hypothetical protein
MTSPRRTAANKLNASLSTGPRTLGGKLRSSHNSYRHGLATPIANDPNVASNIDRVASVLAAHSNDYWRVENARVIAESYFDLARIRSARDEVLWRVGGLEGGADHDLNRAVNAIEKIARYEQRTRSKLRQALRAMLEP